MNMDIAIPVVVAGLIYLPIIGIWAYQTFALKRDLHETEARLTERMNRIETRMDQMQATIQHVATDNERGIARIEGKLDILLKLFERKP